MFDGLKNTFKTAWEISSPGTKQLAVQSGAGSLVVAATCGPMFGAAAVGVALIGTLSSFQNDCNRLLQKIAVREHNHQ